MDKVGDLANLLLILIRAGVVFRITFLFIQAITNPDDINVAKRRIINILKFYICAELVFIIKDLILKYF